MTSLHPQGWTLPADLTVTAGGIYRQHNNNVSAQLPEPELTSQSWTDITPLHLREAPEPVIVSDSVNSDSHQASWLPGLVTHGHSH